jgi:hypothetical protein
MSNYSNAKIYTIRCKSNPLHIYVGSTIKTLPRRLQCHKSRSIHYQNMLLYSTIANNWDDWFIELYENFPCDNRNQLCKREGEIIRLISTLNSRIAGRSFIEFRLENPDFVKNYHKNYYKNNADKIKLQAKLYHLQNAEKIKQQRKVYLLHNAEKIKQQRKIYLLHNAEIIKQKRKVYLLHNAEIIKQKRNKNYYINNAHNIEQKHNNYPLQFSQHIKQNLIESHINLFIQSTLPYFDSDLYDFHTLRQLFHQFIIFKNLTCEELFLSREISNSE